MIRKLEMTVLIDNIAEEPLTAEWGLSILIKADGRKILLDTGAGGQFIRNAGILEENLDEVDVGVLSHAHSDHADGLEAFFTCNGHADFLLREGCRENCFGISDGSLEYIGIRKGLMDRYADHPEAIRDAGIAYAIDQIIDLVTHGVQGIHLYTMNNPLVARKIYEATKSLFDVSPILK